MNQFDAIVLSKTLVKEQDLIINVLHENGTKLGLYIYGGQSSKSRKSSIIEYGHVLTFKVDAKKNAKSSSLKIAKEYQLKWSAQNIRDNFKAFYLLSFYLEIMNTILTESDDFDHGEHQDFYKLLANAIYYLNENIKLENAINNNLFLFLTKLIFYLGIMPDLEKCMVTGEELSSFESVHLDTSLGGFVGKHSNELSDQRLIDLLLKGFHTPFKEVQELKIEDNKYNQKLFSYFCVNMDLRVEQFKLNSMIF